MSFAQHLTTQESADREPLFDDDDNASLQLSYYSLSRVPSRQRRTSISYDPLPETVEHEEKKIQPVAAYEVPPGKRLAQVVVGVLSCILGSGIVFGFAALKTILIDEKVYRDLCTKEELNEGVVVCYKQDLKLNFAFNLASITTNVSALLVGTTLDRFGPRLCGLASSLLLFLGSLCLAFERELPFDAIIIGFFVLSLGGTFMFVPSFHLSNAFPRHQGLILALVTGAFDASAAIFLFFRIIYDASGQSFGLKKFFLVYLCVPVFVLLTQLFLMPSASYENRTELQDVQEKAADAAQDLHDSDDELDDSEMWRVRSMRADDRKRIRAEITSLLGDRAEQAEHEQKEEHKRVASQAWGALHGLPAFKQLMSPWFILMSLFTIIQMQRFNLLISTIWTQYRFYLHSRNLADHINDFFDIALPVGGVAAVPFIGTLLDNLSVAAVLGIIVTLSTIIGVLGALPFLWAGYLNVVLFCAFRPLYYSAMSDYTVKVFGLATFGTIYGTIICVSGVVTFAQPALQAVTHDVFADNPTPVNLALAVFGLITGIALVSYVAVAGKKVQEEVADEEERRSLLPTPRQTPSLGPYTSPRLAPSYGTVRDARSIGRVMPGLERPSLANLRQLGTVPEDGSTGEWTGNGSVRPGHSSGSDKMFGRSPGQ